MEKDKGQPPKAIGMPHLSLTDPCAYKNGALEAPEVFVSHNCL